MRTPSKGSESFPSAYQAGLLLLASFLLQYVVGAGLYDLRNILGLSPSQLEAMVMLLTNGLLLAAVTHHRKMSYQNLLHPAETSAAATVFLLIPPVLMLVPLIFVIAGYLNELIVKLLPLSLSEEQLFGRMAESNLATITAVCLLAPVLEEMLFRGIILRAFLSQYPRGAAISMSALYFGGAHLNVYQFAVAFLIGLLLGWLYERSRSLLPCMALHCAYNSMIVLTGQGRSSAADHSNAPTSALWWFGSIAASIIGSVILLRLLGVRTMSNGEDAV